MGLRTGQRQLCREVTDTISGQKIEAERGNSTSVLATAVGLLTGTSSTLASFPKSLKGFQCYKVRKAKN
jgi:hypothetical protein